MQRIYHSTFRAEEIFPGKFLRVERYNHVVAWIVNRLDMVRRRYLNYTRGEIYFLHQFPLQSFFNAFRPVIIAQSACTFPG